MLSVDWHSYHCNMLFSTGLTDGYCTCLLVTLAVPVPRNFVTFITWNSGIEGVQDSKAPGNRFPTWDKKLSITATFFVVKRDSVHMTRLRLHCERFSLCTWLPVISKEPVMKNALWVCHAKHCWYRQSLVYQLDLGLWEMELGSLWMNWNLSFIFFTRATLASVGIGCHLSVHPYVCHKSVFYWNG